MIPTIYIYMRVCVRERRRERGRERKRESERNIMPYKRRYDTVFLASILFWEKSGLETQNNAQILSASNGVGLFCYNDIHSARIGMTKADVDRFSTANNKSLHAFVFERWAHICIHLLRCYQSSRWEKCQGHLLTDDFIFT